MAGLADRSPEGTKKRQASCTAVNTALSLEGASLVGTEPQASGPLGRGPLHLKDGPADPA